MLTLNKEIYEIAKERDVIPFRNRVKEYAVKIGMSILNQTKLITAASELVRNMLKYAGGGNVTLEIITKNHLTGVRLTFIDEGPGIENVNLAMQDGFSTGKSLGLGLPGTKRIVNEFDIKSEIGKGTIVTIIRWKNAV
jgi:serine/threonine-protein kinase RsbT